jgi:hypothetical protein
MRDDLESLAPEQLEKVSGGFLGMIMPLLQMAAPLLSNLGGKKGGEQKVAQNNEGGNPLGQGMQRMTGQGGDQTQQPQDGMTGLPGMMTGMTT